MKKVLPFLLLLNLFAVICFAQDLISKVPSNATLVLKYSGAALSQKLPAAKFDTYSSLKKKLFEELKLDPKTSLDDMGIDMQQNAYQYLTSTDSSSSFVTLAYIKNNDKFNQFIQRKNISTVSYESKKGFQLYPVSNSVYLGWDGKQVTLIVQEYTDNDYYQAPYIVDSSKMFSDVGKTRPYSDSSIAVEQAPVVDSAVMAMDSTKMDMAEQTPVDTAKERKEREESEEFYKEKDIKDSIIKKGMAENIFLAIFDSTTTSIQTNNSYTKLVDNNADISVWTGSFNIFSRWYHPYRNYSNGFNINSWLGYKQAINVFFDDNQIRIQQNLSPGSDSLTQLFKEVFNSKQNLSFIKYLHPSDLGYLSVSLNTEAMINYYYPIMKGIFSAMPYMNKYSEAIDAYIDLLQVIIDEKAIADMIPGNALFVLHSLKQKELKYITYDYDKNFNYTQVEKTKTEMSPDFTFILETRNEKIFNELAHLPVKLGQENNFNYTRTGDYYTLVLGKNNIIDKLYFMVKDGKCIITTSLQDLANPVSQSAAINPSIKQSIINSNYSGMFNIQSLIKNLSPQVSDDKNKKMINYLQDNINDFTLESKLNGDIIQTTAILTIAGDHKNSLQYFFDVIEKLLDLNTSVK